MSEINEKNSSDEQVKANEVKKKKARKPKIARVPGSSRFGVQSAATTHTYGPCSFELTIATRDTIGADGEAEQIREFCRGFDDYPELCVLKGYGVFDSAWKISIGLNTEGKDADDAFMSLMDGTLKPYLAATPVLKPEFGAGKATYKVLNGGTTVEAGNLN